MNGCEEKKCIYHFLILHLQLQVQLVEHVLVTDTLRVIRLCLISFGCTLV